MKTFNTAICIMVSAAAFAAEQPFTRYQTIIDRKPFGPEPVNFDPNATPGSAAAAVAEEDGEMTAEQRTAEEQQLAASVRVSILNVTPAGTIKVGFTDSSAKPPENYYIAVGGSQNGWVVKSADPLTEAVTLAKDGIEVTVKLGETAGGGKGGTARKAPSSSGHLARRRSANTEANEGSTRSVGGLARLRQHRMEIAEREREDAARKREAEAAEKAEREEREKREAEEKARAAEERAQQREALFQIQEQLKRAREERDAAKRQEQESQVEENDTN